VGLKDTSLEKFHMKKKKLKIKKKKKKKEGGH
jgi:hypothetical protein